MDLFKFSSSANVFSQAKLGYDDDNDFVLPISKSQNQINDCNEMNNLAFSFQKPGDFLKVKTEATDNPQKSSITDSNQFGRPYGLQRHMSYQEGDNLFDYNPSGSNANRMLRNGPSDLSFNSYLNPKAKNLIFDQEEEGFGMGMTDDGCGEPQANLYPQAFKSAPTFNSYYQQPYGAGSFNSGNQFQQYHHSQQHAQSSQQINSENRSSTPKPSTPQHKKTYLEWDGAQDEKLLKLARTHKCSWKRIAKKFEAYNVTPKMLKDKYEELNEQMAPKRIKFSHREDLMIAKYFKHYGTNWEKVATHFDSRTPVMLKNRYYAYIRKMNVLDQLISEVEDLENQHGCGIEQIDSQIESSNHNFQDINDKSSPYQDEENDSDDEKFDIETDSQDQNNTASNNNTTTKITLQKGLSQESQMTQLQENIEKLNSKESIIEKEGDSVMSNEKASSNNNSLSDRDKELLKLEIQKAKEDFRMVYFELNKIKARLGICSN